MTNDTNLLCFKAISTFTQELGNLFGKDQRSLKLYDRLISKTTISHTEAIAKHIEVFRKFCRDNREAITHKDDSKLVEPLASYSQRVYINFKRIFSICDSETKEIIWKHLLTISAFVDPASKAKELLKEHIAASGNKESEFLSEIINRVEEHVDPSSSNPMEAVTSIMNSGIFTDLIGKMNSGFENGNLDLGNLMSSVQGMMGTLNNMAGDKQDGSGSENPMAMVNMMMQQVMGNMNATGTNPATTTVDTFLQLQRQTTESDPPAPVSRSHIEEINEKQDEEEQDEE